MPVICNKDILGFKLSINDAITVENFDSINNFSDDISDDVLAELDLFLFQVKVNVALAQILHDDVDFVLVLERFPNCDQDVFVTDLLYGFALHQVDLLDLIFVNYFHRILFRSFLVFGQDHISESSPPQILKRLVVFGPVLC
jgi:hypothetical protein